MTPAETGTVIGLVIGLIGFFMLRWMAAKMEQDADDENGKQRAGVLRMAAIADLIIMVTAGYLLGPIILSGSS